MCLWNAKEKSGEAAVGSGFREQMTRVNSRSIAVKVFAIA